MKVLKRLLGIISICILLGFLLRGIIFRACVQYKNVGKSPSQSITSQTLKATIQQEQNETSASLEECINLATQLTNETLQFTTGKASNDPNQLIQTRKANCIGYAALFNTILHHLLQAEGHTQYKTYHLIGKLHFLGIDLHQFLDHPFLKDHDFNAVENLSTGEMIYIDPSVSDYLWIDRVSTLSE